jgi:exodeoxyribonuclease VII small subunit
MENSETFEKKLEIAKEILEKLNNPQITLKEGMSLYEEGVKKLQEASKMIEEAKLEYESLQEQK